MNCIHYKVLVNKYRHIKKELALKREEQTRKNFLLRTHRISLQVGAYHGRSNRSYRNINNFILVCAEFGYCPDCIQKRFSEPFFFSSAMHSMKSELTVVTEVCMDLKTHSSTYHGILGQLVLRAY